MKKRIFTVRSFDRSRLVLICLAPFAAFCLILSGFVPSGLSQNNGQYTTGDVNFIAPELLGRPTDTSMTVNAFADTDLEVYLEYGTAPGIYTQQTPHTVFPSGNPIQIVMDQLQLDTRYYYRMNYRRSDAPQNEFSHRDEHSFHTRRSPGSSFTFTVQADSHLDENSDLDLYRQTLTNVLADAPDFHLDLGDTFMCEKHSAPLTALVQTAPDQATVDARYLYERTNFGLISASTPLFLVNGNHEGELGWLNDGTAQNLAVWTSKARQMYYLNPVPNVFYSGDPVEEPLVGKRASWYAWHWGPALFVVLDPYWNTKTKSNKDPWSLTLGERQYRWLEETLASSPATYKFVFIHSLVGGLDGQMRGGIEAAPYFEWGGQNPDGTAGFDSKRPGWGTPIHGLLTRYEVTAVFHGHDHLYARQELDGVVYQAVPQPGAKNSSNGPSLAAAYHYATGTILSSSGHIRVTVNPDRVTAQYVRAWLPANETSQQKNGQVDDTWIVGASSPPNTPPSFTGNIVLGSPTPTSIKANILSPDRGGSIYLGYGKSSGDYGKQTEITPLQAATPLELTLDGLEENTRYYYRLYYQGTGESGFSSTDEYTFQTARPPGSSFTFCIQGDSHPERPGKMFNSGLYRQTLDNVLLDEPDFYFTIGDDFSIEKLFETNTLSQEAVDHVYQAQRDYLGIIGGSVPLFLVNGNHEQAAKYLLDGTPNNGAVFAGKSRIKYFPLPAPDAFYSGDLEEVPFVGFVRDYYAFEWGDALFVVLDPYWHSDVPVDNPAGGGGKREDLWEITLGEEQYQWFKKTLEESGAAYKFVFSHHVLGTGRGGIENANLYEWGGYNKKGVWEFDEKRPNWTDPIHPLMVKNKVTIFFQGHDHLFARQELDGVIYQSLPNPADDTYTAFNEDAYQSGDTLPNSGHVRVRVSPGQVKVDYVRSFLPEDETSGHQNREVGFSYAITTEMVSTPSSPAGPGSGSMGVSYSYSAGGAASSLGHPVEYQFDWKGDGSDLSPWGSSTQSKIWSAAGVYSVRVRARCSQDLSVLSDWSSPLPVSISVPDISITPGDHNFGITNVKRSKTATFLVKNKGTVNLTLNSGISGKDASMFKITLNGGNKTLRAGKTLSVKVAFKPLSTGTKEAILTVTSNDPDAPTLNLTLSGTGQ